MAKLQYRLKVYPAGLGHKICRNLEIFGQILWIGSAMLYWGPSLSRRNSCMSFA